MDTQIASFKQEVGKRVWGWRYKIVASACSVFVVLQSEIAQAQSIFEPAQSAMDCIVTSASSGGIANQLLTQLPIILFTALTLVIFGYFVYTVVQAVSSYGRGEEVTHVVQQPMITFIFIIILFVFQSLLFGTAGGCA